MPINILTGSAELRKILPMPQGLDAMCRQIQKDCTSWLTEIHSHLIYAGERLRPFVRKTARSSLR